ncbi:hypothetical protein Acr_00g0062070 [Actinidia rufa]|uniref:Uncharacterized protein n=1 Tax=Actinidia rufa TaxID=165716 RepID=A0A7J0DP28_9ERIC|nr:hypothetical protein Acr_00g0062070 [Actinidia rufa]
MDETVEGGEAWGCMAQRSIPWRGRGQGVERFGGRTSCLAYLVEVLEIPWCHKVSGSVQFVYGDCTHSSKVCPADPAIIYRKKLIISVGTIVGKSYEEQEWNPQVDKQALQRAHRIGEDLMGQEGKELRGTPAGDLLSAIFSLHMFDPTDSAKDDMKFEINPMDLLAGHDLVKKDPTSVAYIGFDEASEVQRSVTVK